jgi:hypothetical protein
MVNKLPARQHMNTDITKHLFSKQGGHKCSKQKIFTPTMKHIILTILALLPLVHAQCPSTGGAISWNGPCTYETILQATGCALNRLSRSIEDVQEACDAAAL